MRTDRRNQLAKTSCPQTTPSNGFPLSPGGWLNQPGAMLWRMVFPGRADQVAVASTLPALLLAGTGLTRDAEWITSELVTNTLRFTRSGECGGWFGVEVTLGIAAGIAVYDLGGGGIPQVVPPSPHRAAAERGRGLRVVSALASRMGIQGDPATGHMVWVQLMLGTEAEVEDVAS